MKPDKISIPLASANIEFIPQKGNADDADFSRRLLQVATTQPNSLQQLIERLIPLPIQQQVSQSPISRKTKPRPPDKVSNLQTQRNRPKR